MPSDHPWSRNKILAELSADDTNLLRPHLTPRSFNAGDVLHRSGSPIAEVFFPNSGVTSLLVHNDMAVSLVGREGLVGLDPLLGAQNAAFKAVCLIGSEGLAIPAGLITSAADVRRSFRRQVLRYARTHFVQVASTAHASAAHQVEQRLARLLLIIHGLIDGDEITLTHDALASILCVRRPGVTVATHILEGNGLIRARRGRLTILDQDRLREFAEEG